MKLYLPLIAFVLVLHGCGGSTIIAPVEVVQEPESAPEEPSLTDARHWANASVEASIENFIDASNRGEAPSVTVATKFDAQQYPRFFPPVGGDPTLEIDVTHPGGSLSLNSNDHALEEPHDVLYQQSPLILVNPPASETYNYPYSHDFREWTLFDYAPQGSSMAYVGVSWDNHNVLDYLAGGYWIDVEGDVLNGAAGAAHVGSFIDGPEFDAGVERASTAALPDIGTATYIGHSAGIFTYYYGAGIALVDRSELLAAREIGVWYGVAQFHADFDRNKISGCIGCLVDGLPESAVIWESDGNIELADGTRTVTSATYHNRDGVHLARFRLQETDLAAPGNAMFGNLVIENDYDRLIGGDGGQTDGVWEGQFSHIPNASGIPRIIGGTMAGTWTGSDGRNGEAAGTTRGNFSGFFFAGPKSEAQFNFPIPGGD